jgi:hypothetical protein
VTHDDRCINDDDVVCPDCGKVIGITEQGRLGAAGVPCEACREEFGAQALAAEDEETTVEIPCEPMSAVVFGADYGVDHGAQITSITIDEASGTGVCEDCDSLFERGEETGAGESNRLRCFDCQPPASPQPCERCGTLTTVSRPFGAMCAGCAFADNH